jgi:hypothetical protein
VSLLIPLSSPISLYRRHSLEARGIAYSDVINRGRHPLVELCVESYVKNDVYLVGSMGVQDDAEDLEVNNRSPVQVGPNVGENFLDQNQSIIVVTVRVSVRSRGRFNLLIRTSFIGGQL